MSDDERLQVSTGDWKEKVIFSERAFLYEVLHFLNWSILLIMKTDFEKIGKKMRQKDLLIPKIQLLIILEASRSTSFEIWESSRFQKKYSARISYDKQHLSTFFSKKLFISLISATMNFENSRQILLGNLWQSLSGLKDRTSWTLELKLVRKLKDLPCQ